ncbi:MAG: rRNA maturation RNase YbeY [Candidatus Zambryskibacteria bacterium]
MERFKEGKIGKIPVEKIKEDILGKRYELSFAFIDKKEIKSLNKKYRKKNEATDILSFPLDKNNGEILICKEVAKTKAKNFGKNFKEYLLFLVIHGMLHLKGMEHSSKMDKYELTYYSRYRRRYL